MNMSEGLGLVLAIIFGFALVAYGASIIGLSFIIAVGCIIVGVIVIIAGCKLHSLTEILGGVRSYAHQPSCITNRLPG